MYLTVFISLVVLVAALVFGAAMFSIVKSIRRGNRSIAAVSPEVARKHLPLICLISVPQVLLVAALLALAAGIFLGFLLSINPFHRQSAYSEAFSIVMWIITLLVAAAVIVKSIERHRKSEARFLRDMLRVNANSVSTFAFIFAAFASHDVYQLMPRWEPQPHTTLLMHFLNREFLWIAVFFLGRSCVITFLMRVLELNPKAPPQDPEPPDSGPFVPFNPYDLSQNKPIRPLPQG